ncbi:hypothetical protein [uncultured Mediterranean phage uvMED]|nr:hypothetical protein [uncultured Mediterranean phage uvMED]
MVPIKHRPHLNDPSIIGEQWRRHRPGDWSVFFDSMNYAFAQTPLVQLAEYMAYQFEPLNAEIETMGMKEDPYNYREFAKQEITQEEWNPGPEGSFWYDERIKWREGLTGGRVQILQDSLNRDAYYSEFHRAVGSWDGYRLGGFFIGGVADPVALLPIGGALVKLGSTVKGLQAGAKATALRIGAMGGEGAIYAAAANAMIQQKKDLFNEKWTATEAGRDILFAFGMGAGLGSFATVAKQLTKLPFQDKVGNVFNSIRQTGQGKKVNVSPDAPRNSGETGAGESPSPKAEKTTVEQTKENENVFNSTAQKIISGVKEEGTKVVTDPTVGPVVEHVQDALVNLTENLQDQGKAFFQLIKNCATKQ